MRPAPIVLHGKRGRRVSWDSPSESSSTESALPETPSCPVTVPLNISNCASPATDSASRSSGKKRRKGASRSSSLATASAVPEPAPASAVPESAVVSAAERTAADSAAEAVLRSVSAHQKMPVLVAAETMSEYLKRLVQILEVPVKSVKSCPESTDSKCTVSAVPQSAAVSAVPQSAAASVDLRPATQSAVPKSATACTVPANVSSPVPANVSSPVPANVSSPVPADWRMSVSSPVPANVSSPVPANVPVPYQLSPDLCLFPRTPLSPLHPGLFPLRLFLVFPHPSLPGPLAVSPRPVHPRPQSRPSTLDCPLRTLCFPPVLPSTLDCPL
ncbi:hypothetical protein PO909_019052 [Leuciscus waleckii]